MGCNYSEWGLQANCNITGGPHLVQVQNQQTGEPGPKSTGLSYTENSDCLQYP